MYKGDLFLPYFFYKNFQKTLAFFSFMYYNKNVINDTQEVQIMFTTVQGLTTLIDEDIAYIKDAKNHHECSEDEYNAYLIKMYALLDGRISALKSISCNHKLIDKYERKVEEIKND